MAEPDNIVLEHLRAVRGKLDDLDRKVDGLERKLDSKAEAGQVADLERKLDGLTHVVISSFGSIVNHLDSIDRRVSRLEHERV